MATIKMPVFKNYTFEKSLGDTFQTIVQDRYDENRLFFIPDKANYLMIYDFTLGTYKNIALPKKEASAYYGGGYQISRYVVFLSCSDEKVGNVLVNVYTRKVEAKPTDHFIRCFIPYKDDKLIGFHGETNDICIYDYKNSTHETILTKASDFGCTIVYLGGDIVYTSEKQKSADTADNFICIYNLKTKTSTYSIKLHTTTTNKHPLSLTRIDDDHIASIPRSHNDLIIYQVSTNKIVHRIKLDQKGGGPPFLCGHATCVDGENIWIPSISLDHDVYCYNFKTKKLTYFTETGVKRQWRSISPLTNGRFVVVAEDHSNVFKVVSFKEIETEYKPLVKDAVDLTSFVETEDRTFQQCTGEDDYVVNQQGQDILYLTFPSTNTRNCPTLNGVMLKRGDGGNIYRGDINPDTPYVVANNQIVNTEHLGSNDLRRSRFGESLGNMEKFYIDGAAEKHCIAADVDKLFITSRVAEKASNLGIGVYGYLFDSLTNTVTFFGRIGTLRKNKYPLKCMARVDDSRVILIGPSEFPSFVYNWKNRTTGYFPKHTKSTNAADCCLLKDGRIFAPNYDAIYGAIYDCKSMTFEYIPPAPLYNTDLTKSRIRAVCPSRDNKVYCAGYELRSNAYIYDVDKKSWQVLPATSKKSMMGVVLMPDGSGCFTGGWRTGNRRLMKYTSDGTLSEHLEVNSDGYTYAVYGSALTPDGQIVMHNGNNEGSRVERKHVILTSSNNELLHVFDAGDVNYYGATILGEGNAFCVGYYIYRLHLGGSRASKEQVTSMYYNRS